MSLYDIFDEYMENEKLIDEQTVTEVTGVESIRVKNMVLERINNEKPKRARKRVVVMLVAAVLVVCSVVGVYAGARGFFMKSATEGKYARKLSLVKNTSSNNGITFKLNKAENAKKAEYLGIRYGYVPKGFSLDESPAVAKGTICSDKASHMGGISVALFDMSKHKKIKDYRRDIIDSELTVLNGHDSLYVRQKVFEKYDDENPCFDKNVYVYFENYDCLLYIWAGTDLSKSELYKILENAELFECDKAQAINSLDWQDNYYEKMYLEGNEDEEAKKTVASPEDNRFVKVGESFKPADDEENCPIQTTVTDLELYDNLDVVGDKPLNTGIDASQYLDSNGKFKPIEVKYYGNGDGINTLNELIDTKHFNVKFLYETVTLKNISQKDVSKFCVYHGLYTKDFKAQESYIYNSVKNFKEIDFDYNNMYCLGEWVYDDFCIPDNNMSNCISIPAGGEITLHIGRFVLADVAKDGINLELCAGNDVFVDNVIYKLNYTFLTKSFL